MSNSITVPFILVPGPPGPGALSALSPDAVPSSSPVQAVSSQLIPCDVRTGSVTVKAPVTPVEGALFAVSDVYGQSAVNPIQIAAQGVGVTIANPSWNGIGSPYVATASIAGGPPSQTWRYSAAAQQWRFA